jgi:hypothetical protein
VSFMADGKDSRCDHYIVVILMYKDGVELPVTEG